MIGTALFEVLTEIYPDEKWRYNDETETLDLDNLKFESGLVLDETKRKEITEKCEAKKTALEEEAIATQYQRDRRYPPIGDQLDDLYHKGAFSTEMTAKLKKVKDDTPKP